MNKTYLRQSLLSLSLCVLSACGAKDDDSKQDVVSRNGREMALQSGFVSEGPSLSGDGTKLVFSSSRDNNNRRIYKWSSPIGDKSNTTVEKLMSEGVVSNGVRLQEMQAFLSPDGDNVIFSVYPEGVSTTGGDVYIVPYETGTNPVKVLSEATLLDVRFSPGTASKFFLLSVFKDKEKKTYLGEVANPTNIKLASDSTEESPLFFLEGESPYAFIVKQEQVSKTLLLKYTFSDASFSDLESEEWTSSLPAETLTMPARKFSRGKERAYFARDITQNSTYVKLNGNSSKLTDKELDNLEAKYKQQVEHDIVSVDLNGGDFRVEENWDFKGNELLSLSLSRSNTMGTYLLADRHLCEGVEDSVTSQALFLVDLADPSSNVRLLPLYDETSKQWTLGSDPCVIPEGKSAGFNIISTEIYSTSSLDKYRIVYTSTNSFDDSNASLMILDKIPENAEATILAIP